MQRCIACRNNNAQQHASHHAAHGSLDGLVGADDRRQLMLAERASRKICGGIPAPGKAQNQENKIQRIVAVCRSRQKLLEINEGIKAEHDDAGKQHHAAQLCIIDGL